MWLWTVLCSCDFQLCSQWWELTRPFSLVASSCVHSHPLICLYRLSLCTSQLELEHDESDSCVAAHCFPTELPHTSSVTEIPINILKLLLLTSYAEIFTFSRKDQQCFCRTFALVATSLQQCVP